jgi:hypothetical protein
MARNSNPLSGSTAALARSRRRLNGLARGTMGTGCRSVTCGADEPAVQSYAYWRGLGPSGPDCYLWLQLVVAPSRRSAAAKRPKDRKTSN